MAPSPRIRRAARTERGDFLFEYDAGGVLLAIRLPRPGRRAPAALPGVEAPVGRWLRAFLRGEGPPYPGPWRMPGDPRSFQGRVWRELARIPAGRTRTYGELARLCGSPGAARAVGNAMARNPLPLVLPCHRVLASDGLGGYGGGLDLKEELLRAEGALAPA